MTWLVVFLVYIAQMGSVSCSTDEVKSGEKLMTSLRRVQQKLHSIRSIITKHSDHFCSTSLNRTDVGLSDLQNCANHQIYVKDEWTRAMNPTLFELRHFRQTLLKVTGARKVLSPYFLAKISNFIQDEENIMSDAIRTASEICVMNQEKTVETQTIMQELKKYRTRWSPVTEEVDTTEQPSTTAATASTAGDPISASLSVEEWLLLPATDDEATPETIRGPNNTETTTKANESAPINDQCQYVGNKTCKSEYSLDEERVIFSLGDVSPDRTTVSESPQTVAQRSEVVRSMTEEEVTNRTEQHESQGIAVHPPMATHGKPGINLTLSKHGAEDDKAHAGDLQTTSEHPRNLTTSNGETIGRDWSKDLSALETNWSDINYGDDWSSAYAAIDSRISVIESHETDFNDSFQEFAKKPDGLSDDLSRDDKVQTDCLNCSVASNISSKVEPTSGDGTISVFEALLDFNRNGSTSENSTKGWPTTNNYTSPAVDSKSANCSNSEDDNYDCLGLDDHSLPPLGTHS